MKCENANVNVWKTLNFGTVTDGERWKGMCCEMLHSAECELLRCKCKWLQDFKFWYSYWWVRVERNVLLNVAYC